MSINVYILKNQEKNVIVQNKHVRSSRSKVTTTTTLTIERKRSEKQQRESKRMNMQPKNATRTQGERREERKQK